MSFITTVKQKRATMLVQPHIFVQIDEMSYQQASDMGGASPYNSYWLITLGGPIDAQRGDLFVDEGTGVNNIDPKTSVATVYRAFGRPENFDDHTESACEIVDGSTP